MLFWWLLSSLFVIVGSSCLTGVHSNIPLDCSKKDRGTNSFLWTIQRVPPAYLFGTIHVPYDRVWEWIPENSKTAFANSDSVFFELDLTNTDTMTALASCQMLPPGESLADLLPEELFTRLQRHLDYVRTSMPDWMSEDQKQKGLFSDHLYSAITGNWRRKRPVWVMLMVNTLTETQVKSRGIPVLDLFLADQSERDGKVIGAIEKVEEQCVPLNHLNLSEVIFALNLTLTQHESVRDQKTPTSCGTEALIQHYNCGDLVSLMFNRDVAPDPPLMNSTISSSELQKVHLLEQYFQHELIDKRNVRMAERVKHLLQKHPNTSFIFAFGAGHFLGNDTVIDRLRRFGIKVEHTTPWENIPRRDQVTASRSEKSKKFALYDDFLQPSDVLYGNIQYLLAKRLRESKNRSRGNRRLKLLRTRKRQEYLDSLWESLDPNSLNLEKWANNKKRTSTDQQNNFNDLWVHTEPVRPINLRKAGESPRKRQTFKQQTAREQIHTINIISGLGTQNSHNLIAVTILLLCVILCT